MKTEKEIEEMLFKAEDYNTNGATQFPSMTYEQGVSDALRWALNQQNEPPIEVDYDSY